MPAVAMGSVIVLAFAFSYFVMGAFHTNDAKVRVAPLASVLKASGAQQVSAEGDAGYGPDNTEPWYTAEFCVSDDLATRAPFLRAAAAKGLELHPDSTAVDLSDSHLSFTSEAHPNGVDYYGLHLDVYRDDKNLKACSPATRKSGAVYYVSYSEDR